VGLFRRRKPLHERLLEQAGLEPPAQEDSRPVVGGSRETGIHGVARRREWDAVATTQASGLSGNQVAFDVLPDRTVLVEEEEGDAELAPLADAIERELEPPYRAQAVRQGEELWAVAARSIEVVRLPRREGDTIELSKRGDERTLTVDGTREFGTVQELEAIASQRHDDYVARAERLDGDWWEVRVDPL
jgi:hypothetical protein